MKLRSETERGRLEKIAAAISYGAGPTADSIHYSAAIFSRHWQGRRCLELGPAEGIMTAKLNDHFADLTLVEGSKHLCQSLKKRFPRAEVINALFEDFSATTLFDTIVMSRVLEHVADPVEVLKRAAGWLGPDGVICAAVPNARSVHRQAAVLMGILPDERALNQSDLGHGHRRVYDPESFRADFTAAGLRLELFGGYWLKPLSNAQIESDWDHRMLDAFMRLGERYPDIAAEIYVIARK
jgi:2-polyprenyl-3-methyl-5-hydroxy-6-metoxy-1,4-benzoquinol methylase